MKEVQNQERWEMDIFRMDIIRKAKGITHQYIGEELGMQQSNISKFFSATNRPSYELMKNVASVLGVSIKLVDEAEQINMDSIDLEANEIMESHVVSADAENIDINLIKEWWKKHTKRKQIKMVKDYFQPGDASGIDPTFGLANEELIEIYNLNQ